MKTPKPAKSILVNLWVPVILVACTNSTLKSEDGKKTMVHDRPAHNNPVWDSSVVVYRYDTSYTDSTLVFEKYFLHDTLLTKKGEFVYPLPIESDYVEKRVLEELKNTSDGIYETADPMVCEAGGRSAYNRYVCKKYDSLHRPVFIQHFRASAVAYDKNGNAHDVKVPKYYLGENIRIEYRGHTTQMQVHDTDGILLDELMWRTDQKSGLVFEQWNYFYDNAGYRIFYSTKKASR